MTQEKMDKIREAAEALKKRSTEHPLTHLGSILAQYQINKILRLLDAEAKEDCTLLNALWAMRFAYINKDGDLPHDFEKEAMNTADKILGVMGGPDSYAPGLGRKIAKEARHD